MISSIRCVTPARVAKLPLPQWADFLERHDDLPVTHYWANWDLCTLASILSIGVLTDDQALYDEAVNYWKSGAGNGSIGHAVPFLYDSGALGHGVDAVAWLGGFDRGQDHPELAVASRGVISSWPRTL